MTVINTAGHQITVTKSALASRHRGSKYNVTQTPLPTLPTGQKSQNTVVLPATTTQTPRYDPNRSDSSRAEAAISQPVRQTVAATETWISPLEQPPSQQVVSPGSARQGRVTATQASQ